MVQKKKKAAAPAKLRKPPKRDAGKKLGKKADMTEFRAQLDSLGLKIVEVNADGNCFFRAMGDQLEGSEEEHMKYRAMVVEYIVKHREDFEPFIEDEVPFEQYCDSMLKDGTWAGHMELQAASLLTRRNICIHMLNSPRWYINNFSGREAANMIHLSYHHGEHYNSVRLREDPCQGPAMQVIIKTDANISSANNNAQTKAKDPKKSSHRSTYDQTSVKLIMAGTGCSDAAIAEHVLEEMDGDVDAAIEYMLVDRVAMGTDDMEGDPYLDYALDEFSKWHDENQSIEHKDQASCSSKDETVEKPNNSHSTHSKEKSKTKDCSCGTAKKHKVSCSLAAATTSREPPRAKGGQGKGQKGKKQKKKEQSEAAPVKVKQSAVVPDLGALCI
ncbi:OVARIAN TUMOR DOMAIN-containing deubiquitinating enzyme 7-like isoform X3 [Panicum virgatum]|uniref:OVARIAN TUMOR DOMAIN-containing deubiquitinating enzyme 7-like isoform X3 n=1 Tax=Panicum virgatum TaxID=38727 RepID=UPI0019D67C43|nr:OVARIAN TUMOR DOMAIN-containing deubiquitinating enzyme 7-like isoform X3 [Panicum virgatum]